MADDKSNLQQTIQGYSSQIQDLQQKASNASGDEKDKIQEQINELNTKKEDAMSEFKNKFGDLGQTGSDTLKNITDKI